MINNSVYIRSTSFSVIGRHIDIYLTTRLKHKSEYYVTYYGITNQCDIIRMLNNNEDIVQKSIIYIYINKYN